jgi:hypothetical protein
MGEKKSIVYNLLDDLEGNICEDEEKEVADGQLRNDRAEDATLTIRVHFDNNKGTAACNAEMTCCS